MPEEYRKLIAESEPYISPQMQELINFLDTLSTPLPIEEVYSLLGGEETSVEEVAPFSMSTRAVAQTITDVGFNGFFEIQGTSIPIKLTSNATSPFRRTLLVKENMFGTYTEFEYRLWAFTQSFQFTTPISDMIPLPTVNDWIGVNPDKVPATINNNTIFERGFTVTPLIPGKLYQGTTYVVSLNVKIYGAHSQFFPNYENSGAIIHNEYDYHGYGRKMQWTYFAQ